MDVNAGEHKAILAGRRVLVTRASEQAGVLSERLLELGAIPIEFPTIRIVPPSNWELLDEALRRVTGASTGERASTRKKGDRKGRPYNGRQVWLAGRVQGIAPTMDEEASVPGRAQGIAPTVDEGHRASTRVAPTMDEGDDCFYSWIVFTSANGVNICCDRMLELGYEPRDMCDVRVAAIGPATAAALMRYGIDADLVPDVYIAENVAAALIQDSRQRGKSLEGMRILLPRAAEARNVLVNELQQAGALVDEVAAYTTVQVARDDRRGRRVLNLLQSRKLDIITFTSSSTVRNFMQWLNSCASESTLMHNTRLKIACIGPITARTARELGLHVHIEAKEFTIDGLVEAIVGASLQDAPGQPEE
jgi:uroporphyrinogen-III synthase